MMRKRMKRYLSLVLSLCMLVMAMPPISLAEDATAPVATANSAAALEPTAGSDAAAAALVTPVPLSSPEAGTTADATPEPNAASTLESDATVEPVADPELSSEPDASAALTAGDGPEASVAAETTSESETEPDATPEADATVEPDATPEMDTTAAPEVSVAPTVEPTLVDSEPTPVCIEELLPPEEEAASVELAMEGDSLPVITNTRGVLSYDYTLPEGVSVSEIQWLRGTTAIDNATNATYTLTMEDMRDNANDLYVRLTLSNDATVTSNAYSMNQNQAWSMGGDGVLTISEDYDGNSTNFPISGTIATLSIAAGAVVSNASLTVSTHVSCSGELKNCTLKADAAPVFVTGEAKVSGGSISCGKLTLVGSAEDCAIVAEDVTVSPDARISGGSVRATSLSVAGTIDSASVNDSASIRFSGKGKVLFNVNIKTDEYSGSAKVTLASGALLVPQLNAIMAAEGHTGSYTWFQGETATGTPIAASEALSLSMQGKTFTGALLPVLQIQRSGSELSTTGATSVNTGGDPDRRCEKLRADLVQLVCVLRRKL